MGSREDPSPRDSPAFGHGPWWPLYKQETPGGGTGGCSHHVGQQETIGRATSRGHRRASPEPHGHCSVSVTVLPPGGRSHYCSTLGSSSFSHWLEM